MTTLNEHLKRVYENTRRTSRNQSDFVHNFATDLHCALFDTGMEKHEAKQVSRELVTLINRNNWQD